MAIESNPRTYAVAWLVEQRKNGNLDTDISIQRQAVWSHLHQSNLIMAILLGVPISNLCFEKADKGKKRKFKVIDGKQRTLTLCAFTEDKFPLSTKMRYKTVYTVDDANNTIVENISGMRFSELRYDLRNRILDYQLPITFIEPMEADERATVFYMGNQSVPLSNVHFLPVVLGEYIMNQFNELCTHSFITERMKLTTSQFRKRDDLKIIVQSLILNSDCDMGFSGKEIISFCDMIRDEAEKVNYEEIGDILDYLYFAIPEKRAYLRAVHVPIIMHVARKAKNAGVMQLEFGEKLDNFFLSRNEEYAAASLQGSARKANIQTRVRIMSEILND